MLDHTYVDQSCISACQSVQCTCMLHGADMLDGQIAHVSKGAALEWIWLLIVTIHGDHCVAPRYGQATATLCLHLDVATKDRAGWRYSPALACVCRTLVALYLWRRCMTAAIYCCLRSFATNQLNWLPDHEDGLLVKASSF